ncbi:hypothetical protein MMC28_008234 [Mycoblastus sanguinarius]|nr:hypothetical protein [Mycoblastus sanguinarius]
MFTFDTENDPTSGYVNFVDGGTAQSDNLTGVANGVVTIRADSSNVASGRGRNAVRLTSRKQYTHGLVVLDLEHMPGSVCGIWPAFWMTGPSWPNNGEIDIIEGVHYQTPNKMTMHSSSGCSMVNANCQGEQGCGVQAGGSASFGDGFNSANGGVYAMEWTSNAINIWFFTRSSVPNGITGASPDPSTWGAATVSFQGGSGCTIDDHFNNNNIVFDTTFCGDWAGQVWGQDSTCSSKALTCQDYVQNNPSAFTEAYWTINSLKVYSNSGSSSSSSPTSSPSPSSTPVAPPATTAAAQPSATPSSSASSETVGLGSSSSGGASSENPSTNEKASSSSPVSLGSETAGGALEESPVETREIDSGIKTVVEGPVVTKRASRIRRHLKRHQLTGLGIHS